MLNLGMSFHEWHGPVPLAHELGVFDRALKYLLNLQQIPAGQIHVRQRLAAQRILGEHQGPIEHLGDVMLVDVDGELVARAGQ